MSGIKSYTPRVLAHSINAYNAVEVPDIRFSDGEQKTGRSSMAMRKGQEKNGGDPDILTPPIDANCFERDLWHSMHVWKRENRKAVWIKVSIKDSHLIPIIVRAGFKFHRAESEALSLSAWLQDGGENNLPQAPNHKIGVAGFVLNSREQLLCIQEKSGISAKLKGFWKLPGGLCDRHENLGDAVIREVKEETGIDCSFGCLASIQETHHTNSKDWIAVAGTSDLYCICVLHPLNEKQELIPQESEIARCAWIDLHEFLNSKYYNKPGTVFHNMYRAVADVARKKSNGLEIDTLPFGFGNAKATLYSTYVVKTSSNL